VIFINLRPGGTQLRSAGTQRRVRVHRRVSPSALGGAGAGAARAAVQALLIRR
jgi:hypothetical protein